MPPLLVKANKVIKAYKQKKTPVVDSQSIRKKVDAFKALQPHISLESALKASYGDDAANAEFIAKGYAPVTEHTNHNYRAYFNNDKKDLVFLVAGTHADPKTGSKWRDIGNDIAFATGNIKSTGRYKNAEKALNDLTTKFNPATTKIGGHSLGGGVGDELAKGRKNTTSMTYNKAATIGTGTPGNSKAYRDKFDAVSFFNRGAKHTKTLSSGHINPLAAHSTDNLARTGIQFI